MAGVCKNAWGTARGMNTFIYGMLQFWDVTAIFIYLLSSNPNRQQSKVVYRWGVVRKIGKTGNHGKLGVNRKWCVLTQLPYSPQGNGRQSPKVEPGE